MLHRGEAMPDRPGCAGVRLSLTGLCTMHLAMLQALGSHAQWRHVNLSHNNLGSGSVMMLGQMIEALGKLACEAILEGDYAAHWSVHTHPLSHSQQSAELMSRDAEANSRSSSPKLVQVGSSTCSCSACLCGTAPASVVLLLCL